MIDEYGCFNTVWLIGHKIVQRDALDAAGHLKARPPSIRPLYTTNLQYLHDVKMICCYLSTGALSIPLDI